MLLVYFQTTQTRVHLVHVAWVCCWGKWRCFLSWLLIKFVSPEDWLLWWLSFTIYFTSKKQCNDFSRRHKSLKDIFDSCILIFIFPHINYMQKYSVTGFSKGLYHFWDILYVDNTTFSMKTKMECIYIFIKNRKMHFIASSIILPTIFISTN